MAEGLIKFYGLDEWWEKSFSKIEKQHITDKYQPLGSSENILTEGEHSYQLPNFIFLGDLSHWFLSDYEIGVKIAQKAEELFKDGRAEVMDLHFYYQNLLQFYYRHREKTSCYEKAKHYCQKQIEISLDAKKAFKKEFPKSPLPQHAGYKQLCIVFEKEKEFQKALDLATQAEKQGWNGDWESRMEKLRKKIATPKEFIQASALDD